jgi:ribonuclease D
MTASTTDVRLITQTQELQEFCDSLGAETFVTVDTEFLRESTYYPVLCLIQLAGEKDAALIDPMAKGLSLEPFFALMANRNVLKVFHAARQDIEIILKLAGQVPEPVFDTQVAAMVCGFGDQVGYEAIARKLVGAQIDKSSQFTDWSRRPLTAKQMAYALSDVTHLRTVYAKLMTEIQSGGKSPWLADEFSDLANPATYTVDPEQSWRRIKARIQSKKQQSVLMSVAAWREREAQSRDLPRGRVIKDEAVGEIAIQLPQKREDLQNLRLLGKGHADNSIGKGILNAVAEGLARNPSDVPSPKSRGEELTSEQESVLEILKLALKIVSEQRGIAPKLISNSSDLAAIAVSDSADVPTLQGWRRDVFGSLALDLKHGKAVIGLENGVAALLPR